MISNIERFHRNNTGRMRIIDMAIIGLNLLLIILFILFIIHINIGSVELILIIFAIAFFLIINRNTKITLRGRFFLFYALSLSFLVIYLVLK
jgi:hypothetical protein